MRLPPELVLSIHSILNEDPDARDPLDTLDAEFDPISTLNTLFPDGLLPSLVLGRTYTITRSY